MTTTWLNSNYKFRRPITIDPVSGIIPADYPVAIDFARSNYDMGKIRSDYADIFAAYWDGEDWTVLPTNIVVKDETNFLVKFAIPISITAISREQFYIYYGNIALTSAETIPPLGNPVWPISESPNGSDISYTRPNEHWTNGLSSITGAMATITVDAAQIQVRGRKQPSGAIAEIKIDNSPWQEVSFYASTVQDVVIFISDELTVSDDATPSALHRVQIRVSGRRAAMAVGNDIQIVGFDWRKYLSVDTSVEEVDPSINWTSYLVG